MKKVLLVEDDSSVRELLRVLLQHEDLEIIEAKDGLEGLLKAEFNKPDLMVVDLMMPDVDGERLISQVKSSESTKLVPVVVVSGKYEALDQCRALLGAENVFSKPFEPTKLLDRITEILDLPAG